MKTTNATAAGVWMSADSNGHVVAFVVRWRQRNF